MNNNEYIRLKDMKAKTSMVSLKNVDPETASTDLYLRNDSISTMFWDGVNVQVYDKKLKRDKFLLKGIDGDARAGEQAVPW